MHENLEGPPEEEKEPVTGEGGGGLFTMCV